MTNSKSASCTKVATVERGAPAAAAVVEAGSLVERAAIDPIVARLETNPEARPEIGSPKRGPSARLEEFAAGAHGQHQDDQEPNLSSNQRLPRPHGAVGKLRPDHQRGDRQHKAVGHLGIGENAFHKSMDRGLQRKESDDGDAESGRQRRVGHGDAAEKRGQRETPPPSWSRIGRPGRGNRTSRSAKPRLPATTMSKGIWPR